MKKSLLFLMLSFSAASFSQNVEEEKVQFESVRLPLKPIAGLEGYTFTVETPYKANNDELIAESKVKFDLEVANYPNTVKESEIKFEQSLVQYEEDVVKARENYKLQADEYDKLSAVEKIALNAKSPVLRLPSKPNYYKPTMPVYTAPNTSTIITFDPEVLAGSYLKLAGYSKSAQGKVLVGKVVLNDFQGENPITRFDEKKVYNSTTKAYDVKKTYYYITKYSRPTYLKLQLGNEILFEGILEESLIQDSTRTSTQPNMINIEKESVRQSIAMANDFINSNYGYSQITRNIEVEYVKNKKGDYDDLESAKDLALSSYKYFDGGKKTEGLLKAIEIWERVYQESDLESNKARIDKKVTTSILINLVNACLYTENPVDADTYFVALKKINVPYRVQARFNDIEVSIRDLKSRVDAKI
jgi:hypothetical protein